MRYAMNRDVSILVLDDDESITRLTRSVLTMHGYNVTECNNPNDALDIIKSQSFDIILVDIIMPKMNGISFIRQARKLQKNANTKYTILSGKKLSENDRREIFDMDTEIMNKPFIPQKLVEKIGEILG